jgi:hypothetical protein
MNAKTGLNSKNTSASIAVIIKAGLLAGTLDILSAFLFGYINSGIHPEVILQYISKTAFGKTAFNELLMFTITGLLVHFAIAMGWTVLFFILYRYLKLMRLNRIITGTVYGLFIWTVMNMILLPVWNDKAFVFKPVPSTINALILIIAIGLPLSFIAWAAYREKENILN